MTKPYPVYRTAKHKNLHRLINVHGRFYTHSIALHKRYYQLFDKPSPAPKRAARPGEHLFLKWPSKGNGIKLDITLVGWDSAGTFFAPKNQTTPRPRAAHNA